MNAALSQIRLLRKKSGAVQKILLQKFDETEMTYSRFMGAVGSVQKMLCLNLKSILNRIDAFDEEEYRELKAARQRGAVANNNILEQKLEIYSEYITFADRGIESNEELLLQLDRLISEISKLNSPTYDEIENMGAITEIEMLIDNAKHYK